MRKVMIAGMLLLAGCSRTGTEPLEPTLLECPYWRNDGSGTPPPKETLDCDLHNCEVRLTLCTTVDCYASTSRHCDEIEAMISLEYPDCYTQPTPVCVALCQQADCERQAGRCQDARCFDAAIARCDAIGASIEGKESKACD